VTNHRLHFLLLLLLLLHLIGFHASEAVADTIELDFQVSGFAAGAPTNPVAGTIVYEAADPLSPIDSLSAISLEIDSFIWSLSDIGFQNAGTTSVVGGIINGSATSTSSPNANPDFTLRWDNIGGTPIDFLYYTGTGSDDTLYGPAAAFALFDANVIPPNGAPEPSSFALAILGLLSLCMTRRRRSSRLRSR